MIWSFITITDNFSAVRVAIYTNQSVVFLGSESTDTVWPGRLESISLEATFTFKLYTYYAHLSCFSKTLCSKIKHTLAGGVPSDGIPIEVISHSEYAVLYLGIAYTALGSILSVTFLIFNTCYRNTS